MQQDQPIEPNRHMFRRNQQELLGETLQLTGEDIDILNIAYLAE